MCETVQVRFHVFPREGALQCAAHGTGRGSGGDDTGRFPVNQSLKPHVSYL